MRQDFLQISVSGALGSRKSVSGKRVQCALVLMSVNCAFIMALIVSVLAGQAFPEVYEIVLFFGVILAVMLLSIVGIWRGWLWSFWLGVIGISPSVILLLSLSFMFLTQAIRDGSAEYWRSALVMGVALLINASPAPFLVGGYIQRRDDRESVRTAALLRARREARSKRRP